MNSNTQLTVGIHILCLLASGDGRRMTSEYIAGSVNTNPVVIRRTLGRLRRAGLVRSHGGSGGGWELVRPAGEITLRDVLDATRTSGLLALHRDTPNPKCEVGAGVQRALRGYYEKAEAALAEELEQTTITEVLRSIQQGCG
jgi:Rrf2 family protein